VNQIVNATNIQTNRVMEISRLKRLKKLWKK
jgi:hypothetical protein